MVFRLVCTTLVFVFCCGYAAAQGSTAQISGTVTDGSGAVLPGVDVKATQTATGLVRQVFSNETGFFTLPNLPLGPYRLEAALPGFRTYVRTGIVLEVNSNPVFPIVLEVGQITETIEVQANSAMVETRTVGVGQVMENERILELPLNGRNVTELIKLAGAAVQTGVSSSRSVPNQQQISVAGPPSSAIAYSLDGAFHNNPYDNLSLPLPFPDALQEFKVETSALSANTGVHSGAQVNAVTKSGTNDFHGNVFEFLRNDAFNAADYGSGQKGDLKRNQYGGTLGGPIINGKLFFFGGAQFTNYKRDPANIERFVPTPAMLSGDFTAFAACPEHSDVREFDSSGNPTGFVNNRWTGGVFNPVALELAKRLPAAQDACGRVVYGVPNDESDGQIIGKIDWQVSASHTFVGRYMNTYNTKPVPHDIDPDNLLNVGNRGWDNMTQSFTTGDTWVINPSTVAQFRLAFNRSAIFRKGAAFFNMAELGVKNFYSHQEKYSQVNVTGGFNLGSGVQNDSTFRTTTYGVSEDLSLSRGNHQITFGGSGAHWQSNGYANVFSSGIFTFNGQYTGNGLTDFLIGRMSGFREASPNTGLLRKWYMALYLSDSWKATPRLTINAGLRWEPKIPEYLTESRVQNYSEERRAAGIQSKVFTSAPLGFYYPGDDGFPGKSGQHKQWALFAPRIGFAWDVFGDGTTSIRGSGGLSYDMPNAQIHLWTSISPPWGSDVNLADVPFEEPFRNVPGGNPFPIDFNAGNAPFVRNGLFLTMPYDLNAPQNQSWNLSVQRQLGRDWLVSASYMGSHTVHMLTVRPLNAAVYFPGVSNANGDCFAEGYTLHLGRARVTCSSNSSSSTNARRRLSLTDFNNTGQYVSALSVYESGDNSSYNGVLFNVRRRPTRGVTINANYTWSHCISGQIDNLAVNLQRDPYTFPNDRNRSRGNCSSDRRHNMNLTGVFAMPDFQNSTLRKLASGWQLSNIYRFSTGAYTTITAGSDRALIGEAAATQPANQLLADPYLDRSGDIGSRWFNPDAFAVPALGTFGNQGFRSVQLPNDWQWDIALSRIFRIAESQRIEVRAEAYNVTNSVRIGNPSANRNSGIFGLVRATDVEDMRILQFALKYSF